MMINLANAPELRSQNSRLTIADLPFFECIFSPSASVRDLTETFKQKQDLPGALVVDNMSCLGMISRDKCFEALGRPFGIELFLKKSLGEFFSNSGSPGLILPEDTLIKEAVDMALSRPTIELYDPIIVALPTINKYRLVNMQTLLKAQGEILSGLVIEVEKLSIIDPLTGLMNRRGFFSEARKRIDAARFSESDIAVMMVDIDFFKTINDIYGHQVGDHVIQSIGHAIRNTLRDSDLVGRYGGEEYIGLLTNISEFEAHSAAERLRQRIESLVIQTEFYNVNVTVSIGICHLKASSTGMDSLFSRADKAMYEAKVAGRNRVVIRTNSSLNLPESPRSSVPVKKNFNTNNFDSDSVRLYEETIEGWARALEMRDKETEGHAQRVTTLSVRMGQALGLSTEECKDIRRGALLHDIGKIAIPDSILFKQGKLTPDEWEIMKKHPVYAYDFLSPIKFLENILDIPYCHHEHWDGTGYPRGLKGKSIPLSARIFTIIDVWDALLSDRTYRPAWEKEKVLDYIKQQSGLMFDPDLVSIFLDTIQKSEAINILLSEPISN